LLHLVIAALTLPAARFLNPADALRQHGLDEAGA
jgi:hypothetical protein